MNNNIVVLKMKACNTCERELPETSEYFYRNKKNGRAFYYSVCKECKNKKYKRKQPETKVCLNCGVKIEGKRSNKKYCSRRCLVYFNKTPGYLPEPNKKAVTHECVNCRENTVKGRYRFCDKCKNLIVKRNCRACGDSFAVKIHKLNKFCSDTCRNRDTVRKRKIHDEVNDVFVSRDEVFKVESYKCKCCGCNTEKKFSYIKGTQIPKPTSPTIDHIIPLNHGGTHTLNNVQLLCYRCNNSKQDGFLDFGEQLKMF
ncbi:HNH endonuclease signature motif containing protein [Cytobacillus sp. FSL W8-0315]|uniref:HNH endonuclease n=1 Tax=Cytobacillus sp. FSL W8-0315 TaxID=2921600 RepID=UPI0030FC360E